MTAYHLSESLLPRRGDAREVFKEGQEQRQTPYSDIVTSNIKMEGMKGFNRIMKVMLKGDRMNEAIMQVMLKSERM